jgi:hypothetical protein
MRTHETTAKKKPGQYRVLILGDSVPYGGSYIDQEDIFSSVAGKILRQSEPDYEILNAAVNAYGPQNVLGYVKTKGLYEANMVIVYFPWGNLRRDFANFYIAPFWSNSPKWALCEFSRHFVWLMFGRLSHRWKEISAFENDSVVDRNIEALKEIREICKRAGVAVYFIWSPYRDVLLGQVPEQKKADSDKLKADAEKLKSSLPKSSLVYISPVFKKHKDIAGLYVDGGHYSKAGHRVAGEFLADFIRDHRHRKQATNP